MTWRAILATDFSSYDPGLRICRYDDNRGTASHLTSMTFTEVQEGLLPPPDAVLLRGPEATAFLQAMMDAAWDAGLRPSRAQDERHLKAHLEDMRRFAFHVIKEEP
jgi:hypothetical protein